MGGSSSACFDGHHRRPVCPARTARRENVRILRSAEEAVAAASGLVSAAGRRLEHPRGTALVHGATAPSPDHGRSAAGRRVSRAEVERLGVSARHLNLGSSASIPGSSPIASRRPGACTLPSKTHQRHGSAHGAGSRWASGWSVRRFNGFHSKAVSPWSPSNWCWHAADHVALVAGREYKPSALPYRPP
jgi:hypothetical protein